MKKTIICNIPMREYVASTIYSSDDASLPVSDKSFGHPINSFLSQTVDAEDELKIILLIKKDGNSFYEKNTEDFKQEIESIRSETGVNVEYAIIDTAFTQERETHEQLMVSIINEIDDNSHILTDITYGPKDVPVVIFTALGFAEKFLNCQIDNILYGEAEFKDNTVVGSRICDMTPLYYLSSVTNTIRCDDPEKARQMLKSLLSI